MNGVFGTMGDAAGAMSVYTGPDVPTSVSQATAAAAAAQADVVRAAWYANAAATATDIPSAQWASDGAQQCAANVLNYAAVAVAAANNAGLAMQAEALTVQGSYNPIIPDNTTTSGGTVVSSHEGSGH
jgi:hypothetical protein